MGGSSNDTNNGTKENILLMYFWFSINFRSLGGMGNEFAMNGLRNRRGPYDLGD